MNHEENANGDAQPGQRKYTKTGKRGYRCTKCNALFVDRRSAWSHYKRKHVEGYYKEEVKRSFNREFLQAKRLFRLGFGEAAINGNIVGLREKILEDCDNLSIEYGRSSRQIIRMLDKHIERDNTGLRNLILKSCTKLWWKRFIAHDYLKQITASLTDENLSLLRKELNHARNRLISDTPEK